MFYFPENSFVNKELDYSSILKLLNKPSDNTFNIKKIRLKNILKPEILNCLSSGSINEIYIIEIEVNSLYVPIDLIENLDLFINFPVLYIIKFEESYNYILPVKIFIKEKSKIKRILCTGWGEELLLDLPQFKDVELTYKYFIETFSNFKFNNDESIENYIKRLIDFKEDSNNQITKGHRNYDFLMFYTVKNIRIWQREFVEVLIDILNNSKLNDFFVINDKQIDKVNKCFKKELNDKIAQFFYSNTNYKSPLERGELVKKRELGYAITKSVVYEYEAYWERILNFSLDLKDLYKELWNR